MTTCSGPGPRGDHRRLSVTAKGRAACDSSRDLQVSEAPPRCGLHHLDHCEPGRLAETTDGVGADDRPRKLATTVFIPLESGEDMADADRTRLCLYQHAASAPHQRPAPRKESSRITTDADVAVEQQGRLPTSLARQRAEQVTLEHDRTATAGQRHGRRGRVDAERRYATVA